MPTRPTPIGESDRGQPIYSGREVAAYRASRGVTQVEVANRMRVAQPLIARYESDRPGVVLGAKWAETMLDTVDDIVAGRERLISRGQAELEAIRSARKAASAKAGSR